MQQRTYSNGQFPDTTFVAGSFRVIYKGDTQPGLFIDGQLVDGRAWLFPRCSGYWTIAKLNDAANDFHAWLRGPDGAWIDLGIRAEGNWPLLVQPDGTCGIQRPNMDVVNANGVVIRAADPSHAYGLMEFSVTGIPLRPDDITEPGMLSAKHVGNLVCGNDQNSGAVLVRHRKTGNTLTLWPGTTPHYEPHIAWDGGTRYCIATSDYHTVWAMEFDESEVNVPPPPPVLPPSGYVLAICPDPGLIRADIRKDASSGPVTGYRYLLDGSTVTGVDNTQPSATFPADAGLHVVHGKLIGPGGAPFLTPQVFVTVAAPVIVQPPIISPAPVPTVPPVPPVDPQPPIPPVVTDPVFHRGVQVDPTIGVDWLDELLERNATMVRVNLLPTGIDVSGVVAKLAQRPALRPLYLCNPATMRLLPFGSWVELWNNTGGANVIAPAAYALLAGQALDVAHQMGHRLFIGCLDNLNDAWLVNWLPPMIAAMGARWSDVPAISAHHYPDAPAQTFEPGHNGRTRRQDVDKFLSLIGGRPWLITECGYHNAPVPERTGFLGKTKITWQLTEAQALARLRQEDAWWRAQHGCLGWVVYQITDAPKAAPNTPINRYGLRSGDAPWPWKQQADVWR